MKRKVKTPAVIKIVCFVFAAYASYTLISLQLQINDKNSQLSSLNKEIETKTVENDKLREVIDKGANDKYIAQIAREKLGYASPGERVFVDTSSR